MNTPGVRDLQSGRGAFREAHVPEVPFVDGILMLFTRESYEVIGGFDDLNFPSKYGSGIDFSIRLQDVGYTVALADNVFVNHVDSNSASSVSKRAERINASELTLRKKHGANKVETLVSAHRTRILFSPSVRAIQEITEPSDIQHAVDLVIRLRIIFVLPVRGSGGGVISIAQIVSNLRSWDVDATVAVRDRDMRFYQQNFPSESKLGSFVSYANKGKLHELCSGADVVVATIYTSVELVGTWVSLTAHHHGILHPGL